MIIHMRLVIVPENWWNFYIDLTVHIKTALSHLVSSLLYNLDSWNSHGHFLQLNPDDGLEVEVDDALLDMDCAKSIDDKDQKADESSQSAEEKVEKRSSSKDKTEKSSSSRHRSNRDERRDEKKPEPVPDDFDDAELDSEVEDATGQASFGIKFCTLINLYIILFTIEHLGRKD